VCNVLDSFLSFLEKHDERKTYNMFLSMLNSQFMNFHFMSSFIGCEQDISIVEEYAKKILTSYVFEVLLSFTILRKL
jgi:hypothetical protein